jgi:hypothetical protein
MNRQGATRAKDVKLVGSEQRAEVWHKVDAVCGSLQSGGSPARHQTKFGGIADVAQHLRWRPAHRLSHSRSDLLSFALVAVPHQIAAALDCVADPKTLNR